MLVIIKDVILFTSNFLVINNKGYSSLLLAVPPSPGCLTVRHPHLIVGFVSCLDMVHFAVITDRYFHECILYVEFLFLYSFKNCI